MDISLVQVQIKVWCKVLWSIEGNEDIVAGHLFYYCFSFFLAVRSKTSTVLG